LAHADSIAAARISSQTDGAVLRAYASVDDLIERVRAYNPAVDADLIRRAYNYSVQMHGPQMRHSGDPYFTHPIAVAEILAELHLDAASIVTALLHDVVEDTQATREEVAGQFGDEIADLVDGVTKLGQVELNSVRTEQAENLQKFVLAITQDVRVLLVKLADRLHNMRTLQFHPKASSRERIARETADIYAPLARRIGVERISAELEDLSFLHLNPGAYDSIRARLEQLRIESAHAVSEVSLAVIKRLEEAGIAAVVYGREKRPYSIWRKLQRKSVGFAELADVYGFRVLVDTEEECYLALGAIHTSWRYTPDRFRDYISVPKPNNYRSLHTTVMGPAQTRVELQIRTHEMHEIADRGVAAHWRYKDNSYRFDPAAAKAAGGDPLERLRPFVEILEHGGDPEEFLEHAKMEMFTDQVFTFTPKGKLIPLPQGAMPLDFAYAIHSEIGDTAVGAIINGRERPLSTPLRNADVVEIVRAR
jgi:GTP pyrophosphokinase/guanosine-3',5'-bis(diphosphate) 3'-pyrophosphohydrolase